MNKGAENDSAFEREIPVFEILNIARDPVFDIGTVAGFAPKPTNLSKASDTWFDESAHMIVGH